jgi:hypothetical protein
VQNRAVSCFGEGCSPSGRFATIYTLKKIWSMFSLWCAEKQVQFMELEVYAPLCIFPLIKDSHNLYVIPGEDTK